jgi:threonylcarbamoyladenosine tRNA methylthiotransferase MtaB
MVSVDVGVHTLGCKVNQSESEEIQHELLSYGFNIVDPHETEADTYIINTCSVTVSAESSGRKIARRFRRKSPESTIIFTGCYAELAGEELQEELPEVDYIVGTSDKSAIPRLVLDESDMNGRPDGEGECEVAFRNRKFLKIQDGCDDFCTFCVIPHTRPTVESMDPETVITKIKRLSEEEGYGEIVISGVHLGEYGKDLEEDCDLTGLVERIARADLDCRIRLSSIEPQDVTPRLVKIVANEDRFCSHLHLPIQSGADPVLDRMQRNYDRDYIYELADLCRDEDPDFALNTDVIVGFPGESEEDFQRTREVLEDIVFSRLHVFRYSERPGTTAAKMDDQVHSKVRKERCKNLIELGESLENQFAERFEGRRDTVLVEDQQVEGAPVGYTQYYLPARVEGSVEANERRDVQLGAFNGEYFEAEVAGS